MKPLGQNRNTAASTIEKKCAYCGKTFFTYSDKIRYCNKSCSAHGRKTQYGRPSKERESEIVRIRITRPLECVYPEMQPKVGGVYSAEKNDSGEFKKFYVIRGIGKYGVVVRNDECEELNE